MIDVLTGALVSAPLACAVWWRRKITGPGAAAGILLGGIVYAGMFLAGLAVLLTALVLTLLGSRAGLARKRALGIEEAHGGRRGAANIVANCGVGALIAGLEAWGWGWSTPVYAAAFVAAIAAGASDTVATEIGKAWGGPPRSFPSFRVVAPGTPGAISIVGTVSGAVAAAVIALPAALLWLIAFDCTVIIAFACAIASLVESAMGTAAWRPLNNHTRNAINTAVAAALAGWWCAS